MPSLFETAVNLWASTQHKDACKHARWESGVWPKAAVPVTFYDKFLWRKLFDHDPRFVQFTDKIAVKEYVRATCPHLSFAKLLWTGTNAADIPRDLLTGPALLKPNNSCGKQILLPGPDYDRDRVQKETEAWLATPYGIGLREWAYQHVKPQLLIEEYLTNPTSKTLIEYGITCFAGVPKTIVVLERTWDPDRDNVKTERKRIYDTQGNPYRALAPHAAPAIQFTPAHRFEDALAFATQLSAGLDYVRVDLRLLEDRLCFGELTLYANAGVTGLSHPELRQHYGELWDIRGTWFLNTPQTGMRKRYADWLRQRL